MITLLFACFFLLYSYVPVAGVISVLGYNGVHCSGLPGKEGEVRHRGGQTSLYFEPLECAGLGSRAYLLCLSDNS